jgi:hypothetical protein
MTHADDTIRVLIPLKVRKKNGRPKILPPADYLPSEDQTQDPHVLRAIGRAWTLASSARSRIWPRPSGWRNGT